MNRQPPHKFLQLLPRKCPGWRFPAAAAPELTARQRQDIDNWLKKLHRQFGHCYNRRLEEMMRRPSTHPTTLSLVECFRRQACEECKVLQTRNAVASHDVQAGESTEHGGDIRPLAQQIVEHVSSRCVMARVFEETLQRLTSNNSTAECRDSQQLTTLPWERGLYSSRSNAHAWKIHSVTVLVCTRRQKENCFTLSEKDWISPATWRNGL